MITERLVKIVAVKCHWLPKASVTLVL